MAQGGVSSGHPLSYDSSRCHLTFRYTQDSLFLILECLVGLFVFRLLLLRSSELGFRG